MGEDGVEMMRRWSRDARDRREGMRRRRARRLRGLRDALRWALIGALMTVSLWALWDALRNDDAAYRCREQTERIEGC